MPCKCLNPNRRSFVIGAGKKAPIDSRRLPGKIVNLIRSAWSNRRASLPASLSYMTQLILDKSAFNKTVRLVALRVPNRSCRQFLTSDALKPFLINRAKVLTVAKDPDHTGKRLVLLKEELTSIDDLPESAQILIKQHEATAISYELKLSYDHVSADQVMKEILPESCIVSAYETIGHIAHLNLRDRQLPYKHIIAQILLDKFPNLTTVVNKVGSISNEFRVFEMEVIGGVDDLNTEVVEHGCRYRFNFAEVYWNSRLQTEHLRIADSFAKGGVVCDLFCGVGPFAIPAARRRACSVYANDLNPNSINALRANIQLNDLQGAIIASNKDARDFFRHARIRQRAGDLPMFDAIVMNLPAIALEFLDIFQGAFEPDEKRPIVHVYCFSSADDKENDILSRAESALGCRIDNPSYHWVRAVAPKKDMFCLSFIVPPHDAWNSERPNKRLCTE